MKKIVRKIVEGVQTFWPQALFAAAGVGYIVWISKHDVSAVLTASYLIGGMVGYGVVSKAFKRQHQVWLIKESMERATGKTLEMLEESGAFRKDWKQRWNRYVKKHAEDDE